MVTTHPYLMPYPDSPGWFFRLTPAGEELVVSLLISLMRRCPPFLPWFPADDVWVDRDGVETRAQVRRVSFSRIDFDEEWRMVTVTSAEEFERAVERLRDVAGEEAI